MATKVSKRLYIGLGGTGVKSIIRTKKMFLETYGEIPPSIHFLGIDTDMGEFTKKVNANVQENGAIVNQEVFLDKNEQVQLKIDNALNTYENFKDDLFSWMPQNKQNIKGLSTLKNNGAGQIRSNGRFVLVKNANMVKQAISSAITKITSAENRDNDKYQIVGDNYEIHIVFSICGGTGCGTFLDVAYIARDAANSEDVKIMGYAMLPGIFVQECGENQIPRGRQNAYGALLDLDWLMSGVNPYEKIELKYLNYEPELSKDQRPFDAVTLIDGTNKVGDSFTKTTQLFDVISLALVTSAGSVDEAVGSALDNACKDTETRAIFDKEAWAVGMGVSEVVFRGENVGEVYAIKAARMLIQELLYSCEDVNGIANSWIDKVQIREHEKDDVLDYLLNPNSNRGVFEISEDDYTSFNFQNVDSYISGQIKIDEISERRINLTKNVSKSLHELIHEKMNNNCGVGGCAAIISEIKSQIDLYLKEMNDESDDLKLQVQQLEERIKTAISDLKDINKLTGFKAIGKSKKQREKADEIQSKVVSYASIKRDFARHNEAIIFFTNLLVELNKKAEKIQIIKGRLEAVDKKYTDDLPNLQNSKLGSTTFQIDLSDRYSRTVSVDTKDVRLDEFIKHINSSIDEFDKLTDAEVSKRLLDFTHTMRECKNWANKSIESVLRELKGLDDKNTSKDFEFVISQLKTKSEVLFEYDDKGFAGFRESAPVDMYYVGVPDNENSVMVGQFEKMLFGNEIENKVTYVSTGMANRIIVYHFYYSVPAYVVKSVNNYFSKYRSNPDVSFHIDSHIERDLQLAQFGLIPSKKSSKDEAMELWVKGLILGKIKNENNWYSYYDEKKKNNATTKGWIKLVESWRDKAFEEFQKKVNDVKDQYLRDWEDRKLHNLDGYNEMLEDVRANYLEKYSQLKLDLKTLNKGGYSGVNDLVTKELTYISDELK